MRIVAVDIGGTHARFAIAEVEGGGVRSLGEPVTLKTAEHPDLASAWRAFGARLGHDVPRHAGIAFAGPVSGSELKLTNSPWTIRKAAIDETLGIDGHVLVNDFAAVAHAVAQLPGDQFQAVCGPETPLPAQGVISIVGPGTGLGVGLLHRIGGTYHVIATEGGHSDFAPLDPIEDAILQRLRGIFRRVSAERLLCGPGLVNIYESLAVIGGQPVPIRDDKALWTAALEGSDDLAVAALDRFCLSLGSFAGDLALAQGGQAVVIGGGLGLRLADRLPHSGFASRFTAKGRFETLMGSLPVKVIIHPQPGLFGAAAAFAKEHEHE